MKNSLMRLGEKCQLKKKEAAIEIDFTAKSCS